MKITKERHVIWCCDKAEEYSEYFNLECGKYVMIIDYEGYDVFMNEPMNFCPFCGAKTEVEK